jgi:hypothetical protein
MKKPMVCAAKRTIDKCPSQIWYLMLDSDVRPTRGRIEDPLVTGKNKNAQHMFPMYPSLKDTLLNFASHLIHNNNQYIKLYNRSEDK